jgi:tetratricopeptide (TPR) repeat protein
MEEYSEALSFYEKALQIYERTLPPNHPDLIACYGNISQLYETMGEHSKALSYYEQLVQAQKKTLSKDHPNSTTSYNHIDHIYNTNKGGSSINSATCRPIIVIEQDPIGEKPLRLTNFRKKLEKLGKKM